MTRLISSCCADRPRGSLATSISSTSLRQLAEQLARRQPVGHHDVGLHQRVPPGDRDQLRVARAAADQHHAGRAVALVPGHDRPSRSCSRISSRTAAERRGLAVAEHRHGHRRRAARRPGSRRVASRGVVGADAEDPALLGRRG